MKLRAKILLILILFVGATSCLQAQSSTQAERYWNDLAYLKASDAYAKLLKKDPKNVLYLKRAANSFYEIGNYKSASRFFASLEKSGGLEGDDVFTYFQILLMQNEDDEAKRVLDNNIMNASNSELYSVLNTWQQNFAQREDLKNGVYNIEVQPVGINSKQADFAPTFYGNGIVFTSSRVNPGSKGGVFAWDGTSFLDLYYAQMNNNGDLTKPQPFDDDVNTEYHDGPVAFADNGQTMYLSRSFFKEESDKKIKGDKEGVVNTKIQIVSKDNNGKWLKITEFPYNNPEFMIAHAAVSADGHTLVYASNEDGGYGKSDLYVCTGDEFGWSEPVNLGSYINTAGEEVFPSINSDGDLFFSSNGLLGLGGLDVFLVPGFLDGGRDVINLGTPVNSAYDDFGVVYDFNKGIGFFSSNREGGVGSDDIYSFQIKASKFNVLVYDCESSEDNPDVIPGAAVVVSNLAGDLIAETNSNEEGISEVTLASEDVSITVQADGYDETRIEVPQADFQNYTESPLYIKLCKTPPPPPPVPDTIDADADLLANYEKNLPTNLNINFDLDSWDITAEAAYKLDQVFNIMMSEKFSKTKASLAAHTDSRGQDEYNEWLSWKRAWSTIKYLMIKGVTYDRLYGIGYGERRIKNQCGNGVRCSDADHRVNRRVEVTNLKDDSPEISMLSLCMSPFENPPSYFTIEVLTYGRMVGSKSTDKENLGHAFYIKQGNKYHHMIGHFKTYDDAAKFMNMLGFKSPKIRFIQNGRIM
ncbi:MAG: OmpA family protein [Bacteroidales bacterium]